MTEKLWAFRCYVDGRRNCEIEERRRSSSVIKARLDSRLDYLVCQPKPGWGPPHTKMLKGNCKGLQEIRFKAEGVQQRPLGFFGPGEDEFTFLFWATEKGGSFVPKDACKIASRRKTQVMSDVKEYSRVCKFSEKKPV